jgi:hypothetical protein
MLMTAGTESMSDGLFNRLQQEWEGCRIVNGLRPADVLLLPDALREFITWIMRENTVGLSDVAAYAGQDEAATASLLTDFVKQGLLGEIDIRGERRYQVQLAPERKRKPSLDLWHMLDEEGEQRR